MIDFVSNCGDENFIRRFLDVLISLTRHERSSVRIASLELYGNLIPMVCRLGGHV